MSAIIVLRQRAAVHMLCDGAAYARSTGILRATNLAKAVAMPTLKAALSCTGPADYGPLLAAEVATRFASFDDLVEEAESYLPPLFNGLSAAMRGGDALSVLYLVGWSDKRNRPAAFSMNLWTDGSTRIRDVIANSGDAEPTRGKLEEEHLAGTGLPSPEAIAASGMVMPRFDDLVPEVDLLHLLELMRREKTEGHYWVGGLAMLTTIDRDGIHQRVIARWPEDVVGSEIEPCPIDWRSWRARLVARRSAGAGPAPAAPPPLPSPGLSRQQRRAAARAGR